MENDLTKLNLLSEEDLAAVTGGSVVYTHYEQYTVVPGDNLTKIAQKFGTTWKTIYAANRNVIKNANYIEPGMVLNIPVK